MVGDTLRRARESQNLTIKDIEKGTSIRALYIEAIEKGEYGTLPGMVYAKGFVRNYANFLHLDADSLAKQFQNEAEPAPVYEEDEASAPEKPRKASSADFADHYERGQGSSSAGIVVACLLLVAVAGGAWFLVGGSSDSTHSSTRTIQAKSQSKETPKPQTAPKAASQESHAPSAAAPAPASPPAPAPAAAPAPVPATPPPAATAGVPAPTSAANEVVLDAKFTNPCWMQVVADGAVVYEGIVDDGQVMHWTAKQDIFVTAGNAGAVEFIQNGKSLGKAGDTGQVVEKYFTK